MLDSFKVSETFYTWDGPSACGRHGRQVKRCVKSAPVWRRKHSTVGRSERLAFMLPLCKIKDSVLGFTQDFCLPFAQATGKGSGLM